MKISDGSSEAEWDHHAFLYWEPEGLVVVPINTWGNELGDGQFFGATAVRLDDVGEGVEATDLETLEDVAWIPFR